MTSEEAGRYGCDMVEAKCGAYVELTNTVVAYVADKKGEQ